MVCLTLVSLALEYLRVIIFEQRLCLTPAVSGPAR